MNILGKIRATTLPVHTASAFLGITLESWKMDSIK